MSPSAATSPSMRAVQLTALTGPDAFVPARVPPPERGPDELLIAVEAAGVSYPEVLLSRGQYQYRHELPVVLGGEVAGTVLEAPDDSPLRPGDRVAAISFVGGFAERATAPVGRAFALPDRIDAARGAALPSNYLTALFALHQRGRLASGETVLVHGAAGGLGSAGLQVARALGARTIAVVSSAEKAAVATRAGADATVVLSDRWREEVLEHAPEGGVDVVLDPVGGERFLDSLRCLAPAGRIVVVGFTSGTIPEVRVNRLLLRNVDVVGAALPIDPVVLAPLCAQFAALLEHPAIDPVVGGRWPLDDVATAVRALDERRATGKLIVEP